MDLATTRDRPYFAVVNRLSTILGASAVGALLVTPLVIVASLARDAHFPSSLWLAVLAIILATWSVAAEIAPYAVRAFHALSDAWIHRVSSILTLGGAGLTLASFWQAAKSKPQNWNLEGLPLGGSLVVWLIMLAVALVLTVIAATIRQPTKV